MAKHAVPKRKQSKARSGRRYKTFVRGVQLKLSNVASLKNCPSCKTKMVQHQACKECGMYQGRDVLGKRLAQQGLKKSAAKAKAKVTTIKAE